MSSQIDEHTADNSEGRQNSQVKTPEQQSAQMFMTSWWALRADFVDCNSKKAELLLELLDSICSVFLASTGDLFSDLFSFLCENNFPTILLTLAKKYPLAEVKVLEASSMIVLNLQRDVLALNYFLSHSDFHQLLEHQFNFRDEQVAGSYVRTLVGISNLLKVGENHKFFLRVTEGGAHCPILTLATRFYDFEDCLIRTDIRLVLMNLVQIDSEPARLCFRRYPFAASYPLIALRMYQQYEQALTVSSSGMSHAQDFVNIAEDEVIFLKEFAERLHPQARTMLFNALLWAFSKANCVFHILPLLKISHMLGMSVSLYHFSLRTDPRLLQFAGLPAPAYCSNSVKFCEFMHYTYSSSQYWWGTHKKFMADLGLLNSICGGQTHPEYKTAVKAAPFSIEDGRLQASNPISQRILKSISSEQQATLYCEQMLLVNEGAHCRYFGFKQVTMLGLLYCSKRFCLLVLKVLHKFSQNCDQSLRGQLTQLIEEKYNVLFESIDQFPCDAVTSEVAKARELFCYPEEKVEEHEIVDYFRQSFTSRASLSNSVLVNLFKQQEQAASATESLVRGIILLQNIINLLAQKPVLPLLEKSDLSWKYLQFMGVVYHEQRIQLMLLGKRLELRPDTGKPRAFRLEDVRCEKEELPGGLALHLSTERESLQLRPYNSWERQVLQQVYRQLKQQQNSIKRMRQDLKSYFLT